MAYASYFIFNIFKWDAVQSPVEWICFPVHTVNRKQNVHHITIVKKHADAVSGWMKSMEKCTVLNGLWLA